MRGEQFNIELETELRKLDLELYREFKIRPTDPVWLRIVTDLLEKNPQTKGEIRNIINNYLLRPFWQWKNPF